MMVSAVYTGVGYPCAPADAEEEVIEFIKDKIKNVSFALELH